MEGDENFPQHNILLARLLEAPAAQHDKDQRRLSALSGVESHPVSPSTSSICGRQGEVALELVGESPLQLPRSPLERSLREAANEQQAGDVSRVCLNIFVADDDGAAQDRRRARQLESELGGMRTALALLREQLDGARRAEQQQQRVELVVCVREDDAAPAAEAAAAATTAEAKAARAAEQGARAQLQRSEAVREELSRQQGALRASIAKVGHRRRCCHSGEPPQHAVLLLLLLRSRAIPATVAAAET
jgi:hypothetical protein